MRKILSLPFLVFLLSGAASAAPPRAKAPASAPVSRWIVLFRNRSFDLSEYRRARYTGASPAETARIVADLERKAREDQEEFTEAVEKLGGRVVLHLWLINGAVVDLPPGTSDQVRKMENVQDIQADRIEEAVVYKCTDSNNHNSDFVNSNLRVYGKGTTLAVVDTGADADMAGTGRPHAVFFKDGKLGGGPGIKGTRLLAAIGVASSSDFDDKHGHGTCCASVSAGWKWNKKSNSDNGHAPQATIVSYKITRGAGGSTSSSIILRAWQRIASEATKYGILVANNSFTGSPSPTDAVQRAIDSLCYNGNVLVCVAAGNSGSSTSRSQSCANGLATGATSIDGKVVTSFSSKGPLYGSGGRFYPDLCACGLKVTMAWRDNEAGEKVWSGTSFASPQTAGAALLVRSAAPSLTALDTKAVILNNLENVRPQNPKGNRNWFGLGFLRDDLAVEAALGKGGHRLFKGTLTSSAKEKVYAFPVTAGKAYAVTLVWHRTRFSSPVWSNLALEVRDSSGTLGISDTPKNLYEKVLFLAKRTGNVSIRVKAVSLDAPSLAFTVAAGPNKADVKALASVSYYGKGCPGTGNRIKVFPPAAERKPSSYSYYSWAISYKPCRWQQLFLGSQSGSFAAVWAGWRADDRITTTYKGHTVDLELRMGGSDKTPSNLDPYFFRNYSSKLPMVTVFKRKKVNLPTIQGGHFKPGKFEVKIFFDRVFYFDRSKAPNFLLDHLVYGNNIGNKYFAYRLDAYYTRSPYWTAVLKGATPTVAAGRVYRGYAPVTAFGTPGGTPTVIPEIEAEGAWMNTKQTILLSRAKVRAPAILLWGFSDQAWNGTALPLDLTPLGAAGCSLLCSPDLATISYTDKEGNAALTWKVPVVPALAGKALFHQWFVLDPKANQAGLAATRGLRNQLGL